MTANLLTALITPHLSPSTLKAIAQTSKTSHRIVEQKLNERLVFPSLASLENYNLDYIHHAKSIIFPLRTATTLTASNQFIIHLATTESAKLTELAFADAKYLSDEVIAKILRKHTNIQKLRLPPQAGPYTLQALNVLKKLTHLSFPSSLHLTTESITEIAMAHPNLQYANFSLARPDISIQSIFQTCNDIRHIDLRLLRGDGHTLHDYLDIQSSYSKLEFLAFAKIFKELESARYVDQIIARAASTLEELVICNDDTLSYEMVKRLLTGCPLLSKVTVHRCDMITKAVIKEENSKSWGLDRPIVVTDAYYVEPSHF